jgi:hypothetical protein
MLICGIAVALLFCLSYAMLTAIFESTSSDLLQTLTVVFGSGFCIGSMGRAAVAVAGRLLSNNSSKRTRIPRIV